MMSNVKKKDVPLISISLVAILFIAAALSLFPQQSADAANAILKYCIKARAFLYNPYPLLCLHAISHVASVASLRHFQIAFFMNI